MTTASRQLVPVAELEDGMELHADVHDNLDRILARAGTILTESHRRIFQMCGVAAVTIVGAAAAAPPSPEEIAQRLAAEKEMRVRFRKTDLEMEPMRRLFDETVDRAVRWARWSSEVRHA